MKTQNDRILNHLMNHGSINPKDAMEQYGIMRLGARIYDLKKQGYDIITENVKAKNRFGEPVHYAAYRLREAKGVG